MIVPPVIGFPFGGNPQPFSNVAPYTHRASITNIQYVESVKKYITDNVIPWIAANDLALANELKAVVADTNVQLAALSTIVDNALISVQEAIAAVVGNSVLLQDAVLSGIVANDASLSIAALNQRFGAPGVLNPETALHDAVGVVVDQRLGGGASKFVQYVDARGNLGLPRPSTLGQIIWYINVGDPNPTYVAANDTVFEVAQQAIAWTPALIPEKIMWLDAQSLNLPDNTPISSWPDKSGRNNSPAQATAGKQPKLVLSKTNGHPAVVADGVDDRLRVVLDQSYAAGSFTLYLLAGTTLADATGANFLVAGLKSSEVGVGFGTQLTLYRGSDERFSVRRVTDLNSEAGIWTQGPKKIRIVYDGLNSSIRVNGQVLASGQTAITSTSLYALNLFGQENDAAFGNFWLGEMILVRGTVTDAVDARVINYFDSRWY